MIKGRVEKEKGTDPLPCNLIALQKEVTGPFDPVKTTYKCLSDLMIGEMGVALEARRPRGLEPIISDTQILNEIIVKPSRRGVKGPCTLPSSTGLFARICASRNETVKRNAIMSDDLFKFLPPTDPSYTFRGLVTWIDEEGFIYFQVIKGGTQAYVAINQAILDGMKDSDLPEIDTHNLFSGRACLAKYPADGSWNRAKIMGQSKTTTSYVRVYFVDYGQVEDIPLEDIRSTVFRRDIPELAVKARLFECKIKEDRLFELRQEVDKLLFDKTCDFVWENAYNRDPMKVSIQCPKRMDDGDELSEMTDVKKWLLNKDLIEDEPDFSEVPVKVSALRDVFELSGYSKNSVEDTFESGKFYHLMGVYPAGNAFVFLQRRGKSPAETKDEKNALDLQNTFLEMMENLQAIGKQAVCVGARIKVGQPCIAIWSSEDDRCYRAVCTSEVTEEGTREVCFIDYGNMDLLNVSDIRDIPYSLVKYPEIHCFLAKIDNIRLKAGVNWEASKLEEKIEKELLRYSDKTIGYFTKKVFPSKTEMIVDLYVAEDESSLKPKRHILQQLVNDGYLEFVDESKKFLVLRNKKSPEVS